MGSLSQGGQGHCEFSRGVGFPRKPSQCHKRVQHTLLARGLVCVWGHQGGKDALPGELEDHIEANTQIVLAKPLAA